MTRSLAEAAMAASASGWLPLDQSYWSPGGGQRIHLCNIVAMLARETGRIIRSAATANSTLPPMRCPECDKSWYCESLAEEIRPHLRIKADLTFMAMRHVHVSLPVEEYSALLWNEDEWALTEPTMDFRTFASTASPHWLRTELGTSIPPDSSQKALDRLRLKPFILNRSLGGHYWTEVPRA